MSNTSLLGAYGSLGNSSLLFRNKVINGDMRIDQRNAGSLAAGTVGENYGVDRFSAGVFGAGTGRMSVQQVQDAPSEFAYSMKAIVTTADTSQTAAEGYCFTQRIEAQNILDLRLGTPEAKEMTISFWVKSSIAGTYVFSLQPQNPTTATYSELYTISSANTWEKKVITVPAATIGTWTTDNSIGLQVLWGLGGGSDRQAEQFNAWYPKSVPSATTDAAGCVDFIANSGATFQLTGVQLEAGPVATPFEHRPYGLELSLCQRYFDTNYPDGIAVGSAVNEFPGAIGIKDGATTSSEFLNTCSFHVRMRAKPTVKLYRPFNGAVNTVEEYGAGARTISQVTPNRITSSGFSSVVLTASASGAKVYFYLYTAEAEL